MSKVYYWAAFPNEFEKYLHLDDLKPFAIEKYATQNNGQLWILEFPEEPIAEREDGQPGPPRSEVGPPFIQYIPDYRSEEAVDVNSEKVLKEIEGTRLLFKGGKDALFYWVALPAESAELLIAFDQWAAKNGFQTERVEKFVAHEATLIDPRTIEDVFVVLSSLTDPDIVSSNKRVIWKLNTATENVSLRTLGSLPAEDASRIRILTNGVYNVSTQEEAAGAWQSDKDGALPAKPSSKSKLGLVVAAVASATVLVYIASRKGRKS